MEKWIAEPLVGVKNIHFGMSRDEVRTALGVSYSEFKKSKFSKNTTDDFGSCHVYYDNENKFQAIEIFEGVEVQVGNSIVFPAKLDILKTVAPDFQEEEGCYISKKSSIGIYAPEGTMESILFAIKGYY